MIFPRRSFLKQIVFRAGEEIYSWQDVFFAAKLTGDWQRLEQRTAQSIRCKNRFADQEEELSEEDLEQAANEFRYARELITAEELEAWLNRRELTVEEWYDHIERMLLLDKIGDRSGEDIDRTASEFLESLEIDGICSGEFRRFAARLSRLAALDVSDYKIPVAPADITDQRNSLPDELRDYDGISRLIRLELKLKRYEEKQITEKRIRERLEAEPIDFIRFELRLLTFSDASKAAEGALCMREDNERPTDISLFAGAKLENVNGYLDNFDQAFRDRLAGAQPKEIIGPLTNSTGQHVIIYVTSKTAPSMNDADVRMRAKRKLLESVLNYEANNRIQWHTQPEGSQ